MRRRLFLWASICCSITTVAQAAELPNIVVILADDMGYGDVHALNSASRIPTPHLDQLASEGMAFTDAHTPSAVCTPTRYGFLTGRYCWRSRLKSGVLNGYGTPLIERERPTIASFLQSQGYTCGIVGKWHLGLGFVRLDGEQQLDLTQPVDHGPNDLGFDYSYIIPASLDFPPYVYLRNGSVTEPETTTQRAQSFPAYLRQGPRANDLVMADVLDQLVAEAGRFVQRCTRADDDAPFFLYVPLTAPHKPVLPHPRFRGRTDLGPYGDFIVQVDATVGGLLQALREAGVEKNTLVIYTSDNGSFMHRRPDQPDHVDDEKLQQYRPEHHRANHVFRGTKADVWEGGHHVPFLVRWPEHVAPGSQSDGTICLTDIFATAADIVETKLPGDAAPDSFSFLPALAGETWKRGAPVIHHSASGMFAIRDGEWKLVAGNGSGGREAPKGKPFSKPYQLFDMSQDIGESNDVIGRFPEVAERLTQELEQIRAGIQSLVGNGTE